MCYNNAQNLCATGGIPNMHPFHTVIFDLDGTLLNTLLDRPTA